MEIGPEMRLPRRSAVPSATQEHRGGPSYDPHRAVYCSINCSLRGLYCYGPSCKRRTRERAVELDFVRSLAGAPSLIRLAEQSTKFRRHRPADKPLSIGLREMIVPFLSTITAFHSVEALAPSKESRSLPAGSPYLGRMRCYRPELREP